MAKRFRCRFAPDDFFLVEDSSRPAPRNRLAFALEADRSTTTRRTFDHKIMAYHRYLEQSQQMKHFGVDWFRVVTITLTKPRADSLSELAGETLPEKIRKFFLFSSKGNFSFTNPEAIHDLIFATPNNDALFSLMPLSSRAKTIKS